MSESHETQDTQETPAYLPGIVLNIFMNKTEDNKLFGKVGFQTMSPKTDRIVLANLGKIEEYLDAGLLKDLDGNTVDDGAVIMFYGRVNRPRDPDSLAQVTGFVDASGNAVPVAVTEPTDHTEEEDDDIPF